MNDAVAIGIPAIAAAKLSEVQGKLTEMGTNIIPNSEILLRRAVNHVQMIFSQPRVR